MAKSFGIFQSKIVLMAVGIGMAFSIGGMSKGYADFSPIKSNIQNIRRFVPGEIVLKSALKWTSVAERQRNISKTLERVLGKNSIQSMNPLLTDDNIFLVKIKRDRDLDRVLDALSKDPSVEFAEPNFIYHKLEQSFPNDKEFGRLWAMNNIGQKDGSNKVGTPGADIGVMSLWQESIIGDRKIVVAVIDTGVDWTHPDLVNNLYTNPNEIPDNGVDDDHNGFIDDIHGWNFSGKNNNSRDDNKHGTHCAGIIGAEGNNEIGVAGVNWRVSILPVKFLNSGGEGSLADAVEAINYARMMKVQIMSNSWGGGPFSKALQEAIDSARQMGILFVAAAGNESNDNGKHPSYPASYQLDNVISVAATDNSDRIASFSNYSKNAVHVAAPGVGIYSTIKGGEYASLSGTSMATPHVAGIAALVLSGHPDLTYAEIRERLIKTSTPVVGLKSKVMAQGRVSAYNAYYNIVPPTSAIPDDSKWKDVIQSIESPHPYKNHDNLTFEIKSPGAKFLRVFFEKIDTEASYDFVSVESPSGEVADQLSRQLENYLSDYVTGDTAIIRLKADNSITGWGFKVSKIQVIEN